MNTGLSDATLEKMHSVFAHYPQLDAAILYGSRAKGTYKNGSDIDLTLRGNNELSQEILYKIMSDLDDLLLPYSIDLSILAHISDPEVRDHINRVGVMLYEKK